MIKLVMDGDKTVVRKFESINGFMSYAWEYGHEMLRLAELPRDETWWYSWHRKSSNFESACSLVGVTYKDTARIGANRVNCVFRLIKDGCAVLNGKELKELAAEQIKARKNNERSRYRYRRTASYPEGSEFRFGPVSEWDMDEWDKPKRKREDHYELNELGYGGRSLDLRTARAALDPEALEHKLVRPIMKPFGRCTDPWDDPITYYWSKNARKNWKRNKRFKRQWEKNL